MKANHRLKCGQPRNSARQRIAKSRTRRRSGTTMMSRNASTTASTNVMPSRRIVVPRVMVVRRGDFLSKNEVGDEKCKSPRCVNGAIAMTRVESEPAGCRVPYLPPLGLVATIPTQLVNQVSSLFCHSWFAKLGAAFDCAAPPGKPFTVLTKRFSRLNRPVSSKKGVSPCRLQAAAPI